MRIMPSGFAYHIMHSIQCQLKRQFWGLPHAVCLLRDQQKPPAGSAHRQACHCQSGAAPRSTSTGPLWAMEASLWVLPQAAHKVAAPQAVALCHHQDSSIAAQACKCSTETIPKTSWVAAHCDSLSNQATAWCQHTNTIHYMNRSVIAVFMLQKGLHTEKAAPNMRCLRTPPECMSCMSSTYYCLLQERIIQWVCTLQNCITAPLAATTQSNSQNSLTHWVEQAPPKAQDATWGQLAVTVSDEHVWPHPDLSLRLGLHSLLA